MSPEILVNGDILRRALSVSLLNVGAGSPADATKINLEEESEARHWRRKFGCTQQQLREAIKITGNRAAAVEAELKRR